MKRGRTRGEEDKNVRKESLRQKLMRISSQNSISISNSSNILSNYFFDSKNVIEKIFSRVLWFLLQIALSFTLIPIYFLGNNSKERNIKLLRADNGVFRVRVMPTLGTVIFALLITLLQVGMFVGGGLIILNSRVTSIFADRSPRYEINLMNSEYDTSKLR